MKNTSVVIFPDTVPAPQVLTSLVPVFDQVVYCQPVENDDPGESLNPLGAGMTERQLCRLHAPAPLGEDRERFLRLVKDLRQRPDDYAAQLSHVSLAGMSAGSRPASESRSTILSSLLSGHGIDSTRQELRENLLWQARLVLKLAEQHDLDRKRIEEDMESIHQREQNMFSGLSSGPDNLFSMTGRLSSPVADADRMQRLRLKAWTRLFAFATNPVDEAGFFVATDPDAVDRIAEEYERSSGRAPDVFCTLPLPLRHPDLDRLLAQVKQFQEEEAALVENLRGLLNNPGQSPKLSQDWSAAMDRYFPRQEYGRCQLVLYVFPGVGLKQLFLDSFGHDEHELEGDIGGEPLRDIVVGLLTGQ
ncbi:MAG: hypothetical protein M8357_09270 [Desulfobulbaceae bacterium]|nr:hypothetical protein [Desulfobulbaceae bacterium]